MNDKAIAAYEAKYKTTWRDAPPHCQRMWLDAWHAAIEQVNKEPPECPECSKKMKHLRLEVLERERSEFFAKWHVERRKREMWRQVIVAAVELVCAPAWAGVSDEDVKLEKALRDAGLVTHNNLGRLGRN